MVSIVTAIIIAFSMIMNLQEHDNLTGEEETKKLSGIITEIEEAIGQLDKARLVQLYHRIVPLAESTDPVIEKYAHYYTGYIHYRLGTMFSEMKQSQKEEYLDKAISRMEKCTELDPEFAEAYSLKGSSYGAKISGMVSGMRYGRRSENYIEKGLELAPGNPRVVMMNGINTLYKPSVVGGGAEKAVAEFKKAGDFFDLWSPDHELHPDWGQNQVYIWLGIAYEELGRPDDAMKAYHKSLEINPGNAWVNRFILPKLKSEMP